MELSDMEPSSSITLKHPVQSEGELPIYDFIKPAESRKHTKLHTHTHTHTTQGLTEQQQLAR